MSWKCSKIARQSHRGGQPTCRTTCEAWMRRPMVSTQICHQPEKRIEGVSTGKAPSLRGISGFRRGAAVDFPILACCLGCEIPDLPRRVFWGLTSLNPTSRLGRFGGSQLEFWPGELRAARRHFPAFLMPGISVSIPAPRATSVGHLTRWRVAPAHLCLIGFVALLRDRCTA